MVEVAPGVELEVIDWGGSGPPMVLLTGLGDNAHVYDQFAFQFTLRRRYLAGELPERKNAPSAFCLRSGSRLALADGCIHIA